MHRSDRLHLTAIVNRSTTIRKVVFGAAGKQIATVRKREQSDVFTRRRPVRGKRGTTLTPRATAIDQRGDRATSVHVVGICKR